MKEIIDKKLNFFAKNINKFGKKGSTFKVRSSCSVCVRLR